MGVAVRRWVRLDQRGELVNPMHNATRQKLIEENETRIAEIVADQAARRADREARGEFLDDDDLIVKKSHDTSFDVAACIEDQIHQRNFRAQPQPTSADDLITKRAVETILGEVADEVREGFDRVWDAINELRADLNREKAIDASSNVIRRSDVA